MSLGQYETLKHEFLEREDTVQALDGQLLLVSNGVEVHFPKTEARRFLYRDGVAALDAYVREWTEHYFRVVLGAMLA